ncbi:MAG: hypothetical protein QM599_10405 [Pseudoxanthomonas sp.]
MPMRLLLLPILLSMPALHAADAPRDPINQDLGAPSACTDAVASYIDALVR